MEMPYSGYSLINRTGVDMGLKISEEYRNNQAENEREAKRSVRTSKIKARAAGVVARKPGRVSKTWVVDGVEFSTCAAAAEEHNVTTKTIRNWCKGYTQGNVFTEPEEGCYVIENCS